MFKAIVLCELYSLSDDQVEYQLRDRLSFMRFLGLGLEDKVPDAKTVWLYREQLARAGVIETLFEDFDGHLEQQGTLSSHWGPWTLGQSPLPHIASVEFTPPERGHVANRPVLGHDQLS